MTTDPLNDLLNEAETWKAMEKPQNHKDAVSWAKGVFKRLNMKGAFKAGNDTNAFLLDHTYSLALRDPTQYIGLAKNDPVWFNGLKCVSAEVLRRNDELPQELADWIADLLLGIVEAPKPARGRPFATVHQATVWLTVSQLVKWKWIKSRNDGSPPLSACDVIADATVLTFDRVKDIVEKPLRRPRYLLREWDYYRTPKIMGINLP
jgi:hypothetical protein